MTYQYNTYWFILCAVMIWIPIVIMCFAYTMIWLKLRKASKAFPYLSQQSRIARSRLKVIQMLFILIIIELICWGPWQFFVIFEFILYPNYDLAENYPEVRYSISLKIILYHVVFISFFPVVEQRGPSFERYQILLYTFQQCIKSYHLWI